jgi:hypothetical protein
MIPSEKLPRHLRHSEMLPVKEHLRVSTRGKDRDTQTHARLALEAWAKEHDGGLASSWGDPTYLNGEIDIYLSMDTGVNTMRELIETLEPIVAPAKVSWAVVPSRVQSTLTALRYEGDAFTLDLTREDGQLERYELGTRDNKDHPRRFVQWGPLEDDPHTVSFTYEDAEKGHALGFFTHVDDLSLLDLLRAPAQAA